MGSFMGNCPAIFLKLLSALLVIKIKTTIIVLSYLVHNILIKKGCFQRAFVLIKRRFTNVYDNIYFFRLSFACCPFTQWDSTQKQCVGKFFMRFFLTMTNMCQLKLIK